VWLVDAAKAGDQNAEIAYLTNGIGPQANYVLLLAQDNKSLDLNGWVTLDNWSGATYRDAKLKLVAGEIAQAPQPQMERALKAAAEMPQAAPASQVAARGFFEYHLKLDSGTVEWRVNLPAHGEAVVTYTVRYNFRASIQSLLSLRLERRRGAFLRFPTEFISLGQRCN
jgi:hypothetical protein